MENIKNIEWYEINEKLVANFKFKSQSELAQFLLKVASYADEINHHPDCKIHKAFQLEITLYSHEKNKITELDYQLAQKIDDLFH
ncbi:4a-hydroxytetrahydrobiopterin dehydratase [Flavobacterium sp.]|jgi:4a-hydroxytetrahydrobiopterin dehydratase|uniref:4a-hydroxytetrahydrobiopterin dehydratase n=1 Tax=Flavobacterium sp. TaxID=239 RepID=UPI0037C15791